MLPWNFSEEAAAEKHMAQLQHNMWVVNSRTAVLSIITGGGKWVEMTIAADPLYQHLLLTAERKFWRCVETGEPPHLFGIEPPRPRIEAVRTVDMSSSNAWAEFAGLYRLTRPADAHHVKFAEQRAMGRKVGDRFTVPVCRLHHRELHKRGDELAWWNAQGIDPLAVAANLWGTIRKLTPGAAAIPAVRHLGKHNGSHFDSGSKHPQSKNSATKPIFRREAE